MPRQRFVLLMLSIVFLLADQSVANDARLRDKATVRGKIAQNEDSAFKVDFAEVKINLRQIVNIPDPPLPKNWSDMTVEQRVAWGKEFEESPAGKKFIEAGEKLVAEAAVFNVEVDEKGEFIIFDVPVGQYGLRWGTRKEINGLNYALEVFGQVDVLEEVDELVLEPLMVMTTPLLTTGNAAPNFKISNADSSANYSLNDFKGKYLFLQFWSPIMSPQGVEFQPKIQVMLDKLKTKHKLELLSICLDDKRLDAAKLISDKKLPGNHGFTDGWDHDAARSFGIRRIPSYWLISPEGMIKMTAGEFNSAFQAGNRELDEIIDDRITGKDKPTQTPDTAPTDKDK